MESSLEWMDRIRKSITEIMNVMDVSGSIALGEAERIASKHGAAMHDILAELESRCAVDYGKGIIRCRP